jgi:hypothetical protein
MVKFCKYFHLFLILKKTNISFSIRPNDQIINVNGHPVIRHMEHSALKLIRESTDFVNLVIDFFI